MVYVKLHSKSHLGAGLDVQVIVVLYKMLLVLSPPRYNACVYNMLLLVLIHPTDARIRCQRTLHMVTDMLAL